MNNDMLQWGVGLVLVAIAYSFIYSGRYYKNDVDKCKEYIKARKIFDETYFETQEEALRIACSCYEKNIITKITIVIGFIIFFMSFFAGEGKQLNRYLFILGVLLIIGSVKDWLSDSPLDKNDVDKCKVFIKAGNEFDEAYFNDRKDMTRVRNAYFRYLQNIIINKNRVKRLAARIFFDSLLVSLFLLIKDTEFYFYGDWKGFD